MQFVPNGPDIPDELLEAHEEGRVVFFCGAGISYPAGLPDFKGLVEKVYELSGATFSSREKEAFKSGQFDTTLDLLERRIPDQRFAVRKQIWEALKPNLRRKGSTDTHSALLRLSRNRKGALRLVTTNFDRTFHAAATRTKQEFSEYAAPMLPIPKISRWDGLVYLHGLLSKKLDETELNRLIISSGDFGLAYLTERWASRFVSELFRNFVVCFVGYSIKDPVLRYMMDALAADRMQGEITPKAWAFGDCEAGQEHQKQDEWKAKGVTPILYNLSSGKRNRHSALHKTLHSWADTYRDGIQGKESIIVKHALATPQKSSKEDDFVGRMLWALSDKSGLPAKQFAEFNPVPSLDWLLEPLTDKRFGHSDLSRLGVPPREEEDNKLKFSLVSRPAPYELAPWICLASLGESGSQWDKVMSNIANWLLRHLDDPRLVTWIASNGGQLHSRFRSLIETELNRLASLEHQNKVSELDEIRSNAPNAVPGALMRTLWNIILSGRIKSPLYRSDFYSWKQRFKHEGLTASLRIELRELLAPKVSLKQIPQWRHRFLKSDEEEPVRIDQLVECEVVLTDHVRSALLGKDDEDWQSVLSLLQEDFQFLLQDVLDLQKELGQADDYSDLSHWHLPSIEHHWQNRGFHDWTSLIELSRNAWLRIKEDDRPRAAQIAARWFQLPYPTFKRLALFAASHDDCIKPRLWVDWLLSDNSWWLWSPDMMREVCRLLVLQGVHLKGKAQSKLETAILIGPPKDMFQDGIEPKRWRQLVTRATWLRLAKLKDSGLILGDVAEAQFLKISIKHPEWKLAINDRDEFSHWMSGTGDPDYEDQRDVYEVPTKRKELVEWLKSPASKEQPFYEDTWTQVCRSRFFHCFFALCDLSKENNWPIEQWREALQTWGEEKVILRSWCYAAPLVAQMPEPVFKELSRSVSWWLKAASKHSDKHEKIMLDLCHRIINLPLEKGKGIQRTRNGVKIDDPLGSALNHPIGVITQILIDIWLKEHPNDNTSLPSELRSIFTLLCDIKVDRFVCGRLILCAHLITFYRVDRAWTDTNLLPLLDWKNLVEARSAWIGFLWSPRLYSPLLKAVKPQFLACAKHYDELGELRQQFAAFLTYAALGAIEGYTKDDFRQAVSDLPAEALEDSAQALVQALEGAAEQREEYWRNRAYKFWHDIWPKSRELATPRIAELLTRLAIAAGGEFPAALNAVKGWLKPFENLHYVITSLKESGLCKRFPAESLSLLDTLIKDQRWLPTDLGACLSEITLASPALKEAIGYRHLTERLRANRY